MAELHRLGVTLSDSQKGEAFCLANRPGGGYIFGGKLFHTLYKHGKMSTEKIPTNFLHRMYVYRHYLDIAEHEVSADRPPEGRPIEMDWNNVPGMGWRRTYVRGEVGKALTTAVATVNEHLIRARDPTEVSWRPGDRFSNITLLQLLHLAPHPKGAALCCDRDSWPGCADGRVISLYLDSQEKKGLNQRDVLTVEMVDETTTAGGVSRRGAGSRRSGWIGAAAVAGAGGAGGVRGGRRGWSGGGGRSGGGKHFNVRLVYKACGGWLSRVATSNLMQRVNKTMEEGGTVRVFLGKENILQDVAKASIRYPNHRRAHPRLGATAMKAAGTRINAHTNATVTAAAAPKLWGSHDGILYLADMKIVGVKMGKGAVPEIVFEAKLPVPGGLYAAAGKRKTNGGGKREKNGRGETRAEMNAALVQGPGVATRLHALKIHAAKRCKR